MLCINLISKLSWNKTSMSTLLEMGLGLDLFSIMQKRATSSVCNKIDLV